VPVEPREIFDCGRVRTYLESYLQGQVPPPERRAMRMHMHGCAGCRALVLSREPLDLFGPLADEERPDEFWAGFWPAIRADIHAAEVERSGWRAWIARPAFAWGAAAAVLLVASIALLRPAATTPPNERFSAVLEAPGGWREVLPASGVDDGPVPPTLEDVLSPTAEILSMKVYGTDRAVTEVVLIVDSEIHL